MKEPFGCGHRHGQAPMTLRCSPHGGQRTTQTIINITQPMQVVGRGGSTLRTAYREASHIRLTTINLT